MKELFGFPVWLFVNRGHQTDSPQFVLMLGGSHPPHAPFPVTLPVFSTEDIARHSPHGLPFVPAEVDKGMFCEILKHNLSIENVVLDHGTNAAVLYRAEELIARLCRS